MATNKAPAKIRIRNNTSVARTIMVPGTKPLRKIVLVPEDVEVQGEAAGVTPVDGEAWSKARDLAAINKLIERGQLVELKG